MRTAPVQVLLADDDSRFLESLRVLIDEYASRVPSADPARALSAPAGLTIGSRSAAATRVR